ncbi:MAG: glycosyltransferase family 39 protein, partial [Armatimonadota bacterium]|nr:glycosyltransferase family 39 protein [Armatimonadota bacterium]
MNGTVPERVSAQRAVWVLLALCGVLYFFRLGTLSFFEEDEPRFASAVRTMLQTGDYLTPRFNGKLRINKPILFYWLAAGTSAVAGVGELGARLPSAILGSATVLVLFFFGRRHRSVGFGFIAALALATCLQLSVLARAATADMTMIFFLTVALLAFYHAYTHPGARGALLLSWAALGFATLAKGPAAMVMAAGVVLLFLAARGEIRSGLCRLCAPAGILLFLLVAVPWYAIELKLLGQTFYRGFFLAEHVGRAQGTADGHLGPFWFYVPVFFGMFYPWACFLPAGVAGVWSERRGAAPLRLFALCWVVVVFVLFT